MAGFDHTAAQAQVARCITYAAGDSVLLRFLGAGAAFPATIKHETPEGSNADRNTGDESVVVITIARTVANAFARAPRQGDHFTDAQGRLYRIADTSRNQPHAPVAIYVCGPVAEPLAP